jgi:hypothetical protein
MNIREEREWLHDAIGALEKKILKNPKGKIFMIQELEALQDELSELYLPCRERCKLITKIGKNHKIRKGEQR